MFFSTAPPKAGFFSEIIIMVDREKALDKRTGDLQRQYPTAIALSDYRQWAELGMGEEHLKSVGIQVSEMISVYNASHPNEMLPKSPATVAEQIRSGRSVVVLHRENGDVEVMCHGTIYPAFENREENVLGMQVVEIGSLIVKPDYQGHGLGSMGNLLLLKQISEQMPGSVALATIKQENTAWAFDNAGCLPVSYWEFPYLSYVACTCPHCSETVGHMSCNYRRQPIDSTPENLRQINDRSDRSKKPAKIPCTLVVADVEKALKFEDACREQHQRLLGRQVDFVSPATMFESMQEIKAFFGAVAREVQNGKQ